MRTVALPLLLLTLAACLASAQTTYYQNQQYGFRGTAYAGYFSLYGTHYTAQDGSELTFNVLNDGIGSCAGIGYNKGYIETDEGCFPFTSVTLGPTISVTTNGHVCTGPSSVRSEWNGGVYEATFTFTWVQGRFSQCYTTTLTGQVTLE